MEAYGSLTENNDAAFDVIVHAAARVLKTPIALISLLDEHRQWFKARVGLSAAETPLSMSFCTHAVQGDGLFVVEDAVADPRFAANPLVTGHPGIRFYAGVPLREAGGRRIGTLCVIDTVPRTSPGPNEEQRLVALAAQVMAELEKRRTRLAAPDTLVAQRVGTGSSPA